MGRDNVSNHQPQDCLLNRLFRRTSKKTSKLRVTGLCAGNSPVTGEFPAQMASDTENVSIRWRHHAIQRCGAWPWVNYFSLVKQVHSGPVTWWFNILWCCIQRCNDESTSKTWIWWYTLPLRASCRLHTASILNKIAHKTSRPFVRIIISDVTWTS